MLGSLLEFVGDSSNGFKGAPTLQGGSYQVTRARNARGQSSYGRCMVIITEYIIESLAGVKSYNNISSMHCKTRSSSLIIPNKSHRREY